jgi:DNA (cytosine-5)-methyltransferase 1
MENVKGLLSMESGQVIKQIQNEFENAGKFGYEVRTKVLKASDYGVPQSRERVIIIGIRKDLELIPEFPPKKYEKEVTVEEAISDLPKINAGEGEEKLNYESKPTNDYQQFMRKNSKKVFNHIAMRHTQRLIERFRAIQPGKNLLDVWETHGAVQRGNPNEKSKVKFSQNNLRLIANKPAPTIAASFQSNFIHPFLDRNFTAREGARLQSFPDDFIFEGMRTKMSWEKGLSQYQQIGNAVPPLMAFEIAKTLKKVLENGNYDEPMEEIQFLKNLK